MDKYFQQVFVPRKSCSYVSGFSLRLDGNTSYLEESDLSSRSTRCPSPENDYDELLKMALAKTKKREVTPEWT